jgi:hypothetical protein
MSTLFEIVEKGPSGPSHFALSAIIDAVGGMQSSCPAVTFSRGRVHKIYHELVTHGTDKAETVVLFALEDDW